MRRLGAGAGVSPLYSTYGGETHRQASLANVSISDFGSTFNPLSVQLIETTLLNLDRIYCTFFWELV